VPAVSAAQRHTPAHARPADPPVARDAPGRGLPLARPGGRAHRQPRLSPIEERAVRETALFATLGDAVAHSLVGEMRRRPLDREAVLYRPGDPGDELYVVLTGCLQVFHEDRYGRMRMLEIVTPGQMVGDLSVVDRRPRTATVAALARTEVAVLEHDRVQRVLETYPATAIELLKFFSSRLRRANESIADMALMDVKARVAKMVLELAARFGRQETNGIDVDHGLSQEQLARYVGASREMVNRALADLQTRRVLALRPGGMLILRRADLES
jgi:CRP/FNR family cyclic AMP-dependent transcriptional regulator